MNIMVGLNTTADPKCGRGEIVPFMERLPAVAAALDRATCHGNYPSIIAAAGTDFVAPDLWGKHFPNSVIVKRRDAPGHFRGALWSTWALWNEAYLLGCDVLFHTQGDILTRHPDEVARSVAELESTGADWFNGYNSDLMAQNAFVRMGTYCHRVRKWFDESGWCALSPDLPDTGLEIIVGKLMMRMNINLAPPTRPLPYVHSHDPRWIVDTAAKFTDRFIDTPFQDN